MCGTARYETLASLREYLERQLEELDRPSDETQTPGGRRRQVTDELSLVEEELAALAAHPDVLAGRR